MCVRKNKSFLLFTRASVLIVHWYHQQFIPTSTLTHSVNKISIIAFLKIIRFRTSLFSNQNTPIIHRADYINIKSYKKPRSNWPACQYFDRSRKPFRSPMKINEAFSCPSRHTWIHSGDSVDNDELCEDREHFHWCRDPRCLWLSHDTRDSFNDTDVQEPYGVISWDTFYRNFLLMIWWTDRY